LIKTTDRRGAAWDRDDGIEKLADIRMPRRRCGTNNIRIRTRRDATRAEQRRARCERVRENIATLSDACSAVPTVNTFIIYKYPMFISGSRDRNHCYATCRQREQYSNNVVVMLLFRVTVGWLLFYASAACFIRAYKG